MKVSVASHNQKVNIAIALVTFLTMEIVALVLGLAYFFGDAPTKIKEPETYIPLIIAFVVMVIITVILLVILVFNVVIDENGITLNRGAKAVRHLSWDEVNGVETYEILSIRFLRRDKFVRVLSTRGVNISFGYDEQALELIRKYYRGDVISR